MIKEFKDLLSNKDDLDILFKRVLKLKYYQIHHKIFFGNKLSGKHRKSDIYWSTDDYIILNCIMLPGNPPLYKVQNLKTGEIPNALYTNEQLQII